MNTEERYILILRPLTDDVPVAVRLRRALKFLLRCFGLRCVRIETIPPVAMKEEKTNDQVGTAPAHQSSPRAILISF